MNTHPPCIYAICDPLTEEIVYVGRSFAYEERIKTHFRCARQNTPNKIVIEVGNTPIFKVLLAKQAVHLSKEERFYINKYKARFNFANLERRHR